MAACLLIIGVFAPGTFLRTSSLVAMTLLLLLLLLLRLLLLLLRLLLLLLLRLLLRGLHDATVLRVVNNTRV